MIYMHDNCTGISYFLGDKYDLEETLRTIFVSSDEVDSAIERIVRNIGRECIADQCTFLNIEITIA